MALVCEVCNSTEIVKEDGLFVCKGCGCKYTLEDAQRLNQPAAAPEPAPAEAAPAEKPATVVATAAAVAQAAREAAQAAAKAALSGQPATPAEPVPAAAAPAATVTAQGAPGQPTIVVNVGTQPAAAPAQAAPAPAQAAPKPATPKPAAPQPAARDYSNPPALSRAADFDPKNVRPSAMGARAANNYVCQAWQLILKEYNAQENPTEEQQRKLADQAVICMGLLDEAVTAEPNMHAQATLIYDNCREIVRSVKDSHHYVQGEDGTFSRKSLPFDVKLALPGQRDDWDDKYDAQADYLRQEYIAAHEDDWGQRSALEADVARLQAELNELKDEKSSHKLFDFAGRREVKDRMAPVKEQIAELQSQIRAYDMAAEAYVDDCVKRVESGYTRLDF